MRIGFVVTNLAGGGAEKAVLNIAAALAARGHDSDVILLENIVSHALPPSVRLRTSTLAGRSISKGWLGKRLAARRLAQLHALLERERPFDLLVSTLPFADEVARRACLPRHWCRIANTLSAEIARLSATRPAKSARRLARYRRLYEGRPLIAVSPGVALDLRKDIGLEHARIDVIPNPFDFERLRALSREATALPAKAYIIHVGRFSAQKRHDILLDAYRKLWPLQRLVLLTKADPALGAMIEARGLAERVIVAGFQGNPYPWMEAADLLVLCSDHEGLPNVLIEALALGTPVVSTDCPSGPREILGAEFPGALVPVGDADALAGAMRAALANPPDPSRLDLGRYGVDVVAARYEMLAAGGADASARTPAC
jgi:glycosyltransferase involved in cell wall biosynthesis